MPTPAPNATTPTASEAGSAGPLSAGLSEYARLRGVVQREGACALPGVSIKPETFLPAVWRAVERGYVSVDNATFVQNGLRDGFTLGVDLSKLKGQRVFKNYSKAVEARPYVTTAITKRVEAGKTLPLGVWGNEARRQLDASFENYIKFPMGAAAKFLDGVELEEKRLTDDHTKTGLNDATDNARLKYKLDSYGEISWLFKQGYFMRVSDVEGAFPLLPLHWELWPFFMFSFWADASHDYETLFMHLCCDFGTRGMPGTFKIFFVDVLVQTARSELVLTLPLVVHVDDCGLIGPEQEEVDAEMIRFQAWAWGTCGVPFKALKDKLAAQRQLMVGFQWDSRNMTRTLEEHKLHAYIELLTESAGRKTLSLSELQSLAGKVQRAIMTLPPMAACLAANMYAMMRNLKYPWQKRRTTSAARQDFRDLAELLDMNMGRGYYSYDLFGVAPEVLSDASKSRSYTGGGYVSADGHYSFWRYGTSAARKPIDFLEGDTVVKAVEDLDAGWRKCTVPFGVDNSAFQGAVGKGWSKATRLQELLMILFRRQLAGEYILRMFWLSTHDNVLADHLSRNREDEFLEACKMMGHWGGGSGIRHPQAGHTRCLGKGEKSDVAGDGPGLGKGIATVLSVTYPRASLWADLEKDTADSLDDLMNHRLGPSSMRTVNGAANKWLTFADSKGYAPGPIKTDDPKRGSMLASFVISLVENTSLVWSSISNYVWGLRQWHGLQREADPVMGVMQWNEFMKAVKVASWVAGEPRRRVPVELLEKALQLVDLNIFEEVQTACLVIFLLFSFSRSESPCPKNYTGPESFDTTKHWEVKDVGYRVLVGLVCIALNMKGVKTDPRCERPEARDGGDWRYIGDVPDSVFSCILWYRRVLKFHGRKRPDTDPFFVNALGDDRPLRYSVALKRFRALLDKVEGCDSALYGLHGLRVAGYNLARDSVGEPLTVAHGGWTSSAHDRYARFGMPKVLAMPAAMIGLVPHHDKEDDEVEIIEDEEIPEGAVSGSASEVEEDPPSALDAQGLAPPLESGTPPVEFTPARPVRHLVPVAAFSRSRVSPDK